jgi:hypothetical protein
MPANSVCPGNARTHFHRRDEQFILRRRDRHRQFESRVGERDVIAALGFQRHSVPQLRAEFARVHAGAQNQSVDFHAPRVGQQRLRPVRSELDVEHVALQDHAAVFLELLRVRFGQPFGIGHIPCSGR